MKTELHSGTQSKSQHLLISGASGYIGRSLVAMALEKGHRVTTLGRRPCNRRAAFVRYNLGTPLFPTDLQDADAVIHLAAVTREDQKAATVTEHDEIAAGREILEQTLARDARFVFISSQSSAENAPTRYGRVKWSVEQAAHSAGAVVVRPGLVYGGRAAGGVFGSLCELVQMLPVLPDLRPRPIVQPVHTEDLCRAILYVACTPKCTGVYNIGDPEGVSFTQFLRGIADYQLTKPRWFVPIPIVIFTTIAVLRKNAPWVPGVSSERILGLASLHKMDTKESLEQLSIKLRPLADGMSRGRHPGIRRLTVEGATLLSYILGCRPPCALVRRYVRGVQTLYGGKSLTLPRVVFACPMLLRVLDPSPAWLENLGMRLDLAVAIAEATPAGGERFIAWQPSSTPLVLLRLIEIVGRETIWRLIGFVLRPLLKRSVVKEANGDR